MDAQAILHSLPRFTWRFQSTNNTWQPPDNYYFWNDLGSSSPPYEQSMQIMLVAPLLLLFSAWILFQLIIFCISCWYSEKKALRGMKKGRLKSCAQCQLLVVLMAALGTMIAVIVFTIFLGNHLADIEDGVNDSYVPYQNAMTHTTAILNLLKNSSTVLDALTDSGVNVEDIDEIFKNADDELSNYHSSASDIDWRLSENVRAYQRAVIRDVSVMWFLVCVLLFVLIWFRGWLYGKYICCRLDLALQFFLGFVILVGTIVVLGLVTAQFALSVQVADVCADFSGSVHKIVNRSLDQSSSDAVLYYVYCDGQIDYRENLQYEYNDLRNSSGAVSDLVKYVNSSSSFNQATKLLATDLQSLFQEILAKSDWLLYNGTDCNATGIHQDFEETEDLVCTSALNDWCLIWFLQLVTGFFLILSNCFFWSCCRKHEYMMPLTQRFLKVDYIRADYGSLEGNSVNFPVMSENVNGSSLRESSRSDQTNQAEVRNYVNKLRRVSSAEREQEAEKLKNWGSSRRAVEKAMAILRREEELNSTQ